MMPNRHTDREHWEVFLTTIFLKYRPILFTGGVILLGFAVAAWFAYPVVAMIALGLAFFLFLMIFSDKVTFQVARFGAWIITWGKQD